MTMGKNVGLTYGEFTFPAEQGFTGSAGVHKVSGYMRGGHVKGKSRKGFPATVKAKGGPVKKQMGGLIGGPMGKLGQDREIVVDDVTISMPKMKGGSVHDKLKSEGAKMGYAYGGRVQESNTSGQFKMTRGKQKTMDTGNQPARRGRNQAEIEAGGTKRLKPGLKKGGYMKGREDSGGGALADAAFVRVKQVLKRSKKMKAPEKAGTAASRKGMPKNVKCKGGSVGYASGGVVKKAGAAL
jgi:hypothetical protein